MNKYNMSHISNIKCLKFSNLKVDSCSYSVAPLYAGWSWRHAVNYICLILQWRPVGVAVWMHVQFSKHKNLSLPRLKYEYLECTMYVRADFCCRSSNIFILTTVSSSTHPCMSVNWVCSSNQVMGIVLLVGAPKMRRLLSSRVSTLVWYTTFNYPPR
jgi:hypothetical protein